MNQIKSIGLISLVGLSSFSYANVKSPKNILFIMADDFNYWTKEQGYYPQVKTPNLDKLSKRGILFTDAHCSSPVSNPSRNAIWSGFRPSTTGIQGNSDGYIRDIPGFANTKTMNQYFMENGYWVYGAGKLYHPGDMANGGEKDQANWNQRYTDRTGCNGGSFLSWNNPNWSAMSYSVNPDPMTESNCADYRMVKSVASFIKNYPNSANKDKPFFIGCGVFRPHLPWNVPKEFWDLFSTDTLEIPKGFKVGDLADVGLTATSAHTGVVNANKWKQAIHAYLASLALADHNVGVLLDALESSEFKDNTIVCFMGDHGWHLGEKERWGKNTLFDAANRTTLIIYDPSAKGNGQLCRKVVSLQDLYPTLVELSGVPAKTDIEGNSLVELLDNPNTDSWDKPVIMSYGGTDYIKTNKWRYVRDTNSSRRMLYDIENDPYEFNNLHDNAQYAAVISRLTTQLDSTINIGKSIKTKLLANYKFVPKALTIPGVIEAEDYDEGGYNQTYYDADKVNLGGQYRTADGTDIYITDDTFGNYHLGGWSAGDWCMYTVKDFLAGNYNVDFRMKNTGNTPAVIQIMNKSVLLAEFQIPATSNWQTFRAPQIVLPNQPAVRIQVKVKSGSDVQFNSMTFELISSANPSITANISRKTLVSNVLSDSVLYLDLQNTDPVTRLSIYDAKGRLVTSDKVPGEQSLQYKVPVKLKPGMYFLRVSDELCASVEKFLIK